MVRNTGWSRGWRLALVSLGFASLAVPAMGGDRTEEGFPLTFDRTFVDLGDGLAPGLEVEVRFLVTNPTDEPVTYFSKPSSRSVDVTHEHIELAPGESGVLKVLVEPRVAGPFRHRIGVVVEPMRAALIIEGWAGH